MHRSGTSYVASLLLAAGVHMGERLMPGSTGNDRGHYENLDFVEFQARVLRSRGYDEAGLQATSHTPLAPDSFDEDAYAEARRIVAANARETPWGWKDPRCTLMLDFWARVTPGASYVLLYREPAEVIESLFRRRDPAIVSTPEAAARAWLAYNSILLQFARMNRTRCILANAAVVGRNAQSFLSTVATRFSMTLDPATTSTFDAELMHHVAPESTEPVLLRYLMPETERLFVDLEGEADLAAGVHRDAPVSPNRARAVFFEGWAAASRTAATESNASLIHAIDAKEKELAESRSFLATATAEMQRAQAAFNDLTSRVNKSADHILALQAASHEYQLELVRAQEQLASTRAERDRALQGAERFHQTELELIRTIEQLRFTEYHRETLAAQVDGLERGAAERAAPNASLAAMRDQLRFAEHDRKALAQQLETLQKQLADFVSTELSSTEAAELKARLQSVTQERDGLASRIEALQEAADSERRRAAAVDTELASVRERALRLETRNADIEARIASATADAAEARAELLEWLDKLEAVTRALATERGALEIAREELACERSQRWVESEELREQSEQQRAALSAEIVSLRAENSVMAKALDETSARFLQHVNLTLSQTHEEAQQIAALIDEIQSSRFWGIKRAIRRLFGRRDTHQ